MDLIVNTGPADIMAALLVLTLGVMLFLLFR